MTVEKYLLESVALGWLQMSLLHPHRQASEVPIALVAAPARHQHPRLASAPLPHLEVPCHFVPASGAACVLTALAHYHAPLRRQAPPASRSQKAGYCQANQQTPATEQAA